MKAAYNFVTGRIESGPVGFRKILLRLGPTFIKIGQFLALRPDLVPQEYCDELMGLLDQVPPFPWHEAKAILTEDLKAEITQIFTFVNPRPVASGSLAQTHIARMKDGTEVAIKIQRPNIKKLVLRDLKRLRLLGRLLEISGASLIVSPNEIIQELTDWMLQEIDFKNELANLTRLYNLSANSSSEKLPRPYPDLCGLRILTTEYLRGIPVSGLLRALQSRQLDEIDRVNELGIDCDRLAVNLITTCLKQIFRYQFFHADVHPGNLIALQGDVIGFVDFGLCDELDEIVRKRQTQYLSAVYQRDLEKMFKSLTEVLIPGEQTDIDAFRRDFLDETREFLSKRRASEQSNSESISDSDRSPLAQWLVGVMRTARRHGLKIPPRILSMYRALLTAETVAHKLGRKIDLWSTGKDFFKKLQIEDTLRYLEPLNIQQVFLQMFDLMRESPSHFHQILSELSDGRFTLNVQVSESMKVIRSRNRRFRILTISIISVGITVLLTIPKLPELFGVPLDWPLFIVLILLYIWIFIQWRKLS